MSLSPHTCTCVRMRADSVVRENVIGSALVVNRVNVTMERERERGERVWEGEKRRGGGQAKIGVTNSPNLRFFE
jgi:hypothetical protein